MALGGETVTTTVEGRERYSVNLRYPRDFRSDPETIAPRGAGRRPSGAAIPLGQVARIKLIAGPVDHPHRERPARRSTSSSTSATATSAATSPRRRRRWPAGVSFPPGYYAVWSGQFEYLERAKERLTIVVPVTLLIIFLLLYLNFRPADRDADRHAVAALRAGRRLVAACTGWAST